MNSPVSRPDAELVAQVANRHPLNRDATGAESIANLAEVVANRDLVEGLPVKHLREDLDALPESIKLSAERKPGELVAISAPADDVLLGLQADLDGFNGVDELHEPTVAPASASAGGNVNFHHPAAMSGGQVCIHCLRTWPCPDSTQAIATRTFPAGAPVRIGNGATLWTVEQVDGQWVSLTCLSATGALQHKALPLTEALTRLTVIEQAHR